MQPAEVQGTIEGSMGGFIVVMDANNRPARIDVQGAKVHVTGNANADFLHPGLTVEFKADIDSHGVAKEKVSELKIITPSAHNPPGLFPPDSGTDEKGDAVDNKPTKPAKRVAASKGAKAGAITPGSYRIVGRLTADHGETLSVQAGRYKVSLKLSDEPTIDVDLSDLSLVAKGDRLSAKGIKVMRGGIAVGLKAKEVTVELAEPLAGTKKKGTTAKPKSKRPPTHVTPDE